jgi:hypothetical protein
MKTGGSSLGGGGTVGGMTNGGTTIDAAASTGGSAGGIGGDSTDGGTAGTKLDAGSTTGGNPGAGGSTSTPISGVITVAKGGGGDVTTIQAAIDRIPDGNTSWQIILIKNGTYAEHIFIDKSYVALVGESREGAKIELALNRAAWNAEKGVVNTGSGVIDIGVESDLPTKKIAVANIFIGNLTVHNSVDTSNATESIYTHAIRCESTGNRVWVVHSDLLATGSDTVALWNGETGMYYHASCKFQGGIDAVCPRGWCYDVDSTYIETKSSAPIWHEGIAGSTQKFVIRNAYVKPDVARNIKLLNGQKQSTVYLLDSFFFNSGGKTIIEGTVSAAYYSGCHTEGGDQAWHADDLSKAPGAPTPAHVTAAWTFDNQWDPEGTFPAVLPYAAIPRPINKSTGVPRTAELKWARARDAKSYEIYVGTTNPPSTLAGTATTNSYSAASLTGGTTYYWRVDTVSSAGKIPGDVWSFTTGS